MTESDIPELEIPEWTPALSMGNAVIDGEHRDFLGKLGHVADLIARGDRRQIKDAITAMAAVLKGHFETEERFFVSVAYPQATTHRVDHLTLMNLVIEIEGVVDDSEDFSTPRLALAHFTQSVIDHLTEADMAYKPYLAQLERLEAPVVV